MGLNFSPLSLLRVLIYVSILNFGCSSTKDLGSAPSLKKGDKPQEQSMKAESQEKAPTIAAAKVEPKILNADPSASSAAQKSLINRTDAIGLKGIRATHLYAVDWNGDGHVDLVNLPDFYSVPDFFQWSVKKKKFIKALKNPFKEVIRASFLVFADFNKDGTLDLIAATLNQKTELGKYPLRLFIAKKSRKNEVYYQEVKDAFPKKVMPTSSVSLIDVNLDGLLDIYIGNWFDHTKKVPRPAPDRIFLGVENGLKWKDGSYLLEGELDYNRSLGVYPNATASFGTSVCDLDGNGYADILTASSSGRSNKVWLNLADKKNNDRIFKDYAVKLGLAADKEGSFDIRGGGNSFYQLCTDYNNDGVLDVAVGELVHSYDSESRDRSAIMTGISPGFPPSFIRTEYHKDDGTASWSQGDKRAIWNDINFDGVVDLIVENSGFPPKSRLILFEQGLDHSYADRAKDFGVDVMNPSGTIVMDYNKDGRPDLLVGQISVRNSSIVPKLYAFENDFDWKSRRVMKVVLRGTKANYHGIGSTVTLRTNKAQYKRVVDYSYGGLSSQNEEGLWFGVGAKEKLLSIEVRWPLAQKDRLGRSYPVRKVYQLSELAFKKKVTLTLLESGRYLFE